MTTISRFKRAPRAALVRLAWARGQRATWRTVALYSTQDAAVQALLSLPGEARARVLVGLPSALRLGALTRDSL